MIYPSEVKAKSESEKVEFNKHERAYLYAIWLDMNGAMTLGDFEDRYGNYAVLLLYS